MFRYVIFRFPPETIRRGLMPIDMVHHGPADHPVESHSSNPQDFDLNFDVKVF